MQSLNCCEKFICRVLKSGHVPNHIGFIMDGNRRYAKKNKYASTYQGHVEGVKSLKKCLLMCKQLGVHEISLFCFSIENFNRSKEEVDGLMNLCMETFDQMSTMAEMLLRNQIKVNVVGRKEMLKENVRDALEQIQMKTKHYKQTVINICFAYDSVHQIETSIANMKTPTYRNFMEGLAMPNHLDILVRTANEHRLSNFMLPQAAYAYICILKENWPEVNLLSFCKILLAYNYHYKEINKNKVIIKAKLKDSSSKEMVSEEDEGLISATTADNNNESSKNQ